MPAAPDRQRVLRAGAVSVGRDVATGAGGAVGLSAAASFIGLCCVGPWAVVLFGVSGAVTMARFEFLRPWLLGVAAGLLAWAFWRVYRAPRACTDERCANGPSPWLKASLWFAAALTLAAFFADELQWLVIDPTPEALR